MDIENQGGGDAAIQQQISDLLLADDQLDGKGLMDQLKLTPGQLRFHVNHLCGRHKVANKSVDALRRRLRRDQARS